MSSTPQNPSDDVPAAADSTPDKPAQQPPTSPPFGASAGTLGQHAAPRPYPPAETTDAPVPARQFAAPPPPGRRRGGSGACWTCPLLLSVFCATI